jgi:phosphoglycerate dehydrogenase-like enzyme
MRIAVTSPSFSKHPDLIREVETSFTHYKLNTEGKRFTQEELIEYLKGYDAAIVGLDQINKAVIDALPDLKMISKYGVGLNNIDLDYCKEKSVKIGWTGGVNKLSVAELVIGNAISLLRNLYVSSNQLSQGDWVKNGGEQLSNKTVGIIGVGHIGKEVIRLLKPFNCKILVNDIIDQTAYYREVGAEEVSKQEIFERSDVVTIHTPLTEDTRNIVNSENLSMMSAHAIVINSARGGIVDEKALFTALNNKEIGGAALDVYEIEPPEDSAFLALPNLICTPHIGGNAKEAVYAMGMSAINHLKNY